MKIVVSCDIGDLGPKEGAAIHYFWNPIYNIIGILPWLLLAGAFILFKENRALQALWILLPLLILKLVWWGFLNLIGVPSGQTIMFNVMFDSLILGFTLNWLLAERIGNRNRFITFFLAIVVFLVVIGVFVPNIGLSMELFGVLIFVGMTVGILVVSFPLAGFMCRKKFGPVRFSLWMAVWILVSTLCFFITFGVIQAVMVNYSIVKILLQILMVSLIYAGILIVGVLPFELVLFINSFWRKRFEAVFGLKISGQENLNQPDPLISDEEFWKLGDKL